MIGYLGRRLLLTVPVLLGIAIVVFFVIALIPGDAVSAMMTQVKLAPDQMALLRRQLGLDDPLFVRLGNYLAGLLKGDLGVSFFGYHPVLRLIRENFPATLELTVAAMGVAVILGLPLGMIAALRHNTWLDLSGMTVALIGISIPGFWLGLMMIQFFSVQFGWLPITGHGLRPLIMPAIALGVAESAVLARLTRASLLEVLREDFVRTAKAKGLGMRPVVLRHAFRAALIPVLTMFGMQFGTLIGGAVVIENVFARQGLGTLVTKAVINRDAPVVQGVVLVAAVLYVLVNLTVDALYAFIDPRIRYE
ncbi:MAG TPA: ABC transporter permease [Trueperaceae bacterium]|nr:ABC transporter permease [Trueperaceae bacterium]